MLFEAKFMDKDILTAEYRYMEVYQPPGLTVKDVIRVMMKTNINEKLIRASFQDLDKDDNGVVLLKYQRLD